MNTTIIPKKMLDFAKILWKYGISRKIKTIIKSFTEINQLRILSDFRIRSNSSFGSSSLSKSKSISELMLKIKKKLIYLGSFLQP